MPREYHETCGLLRDCILKKITVMLGIIPKLASLNDKNTILKQFYELLSFKYHSPETLNLFLDEFKIDLADDSAHLLDRVRIQLPKDSNYEANFESAKIIIESSTSESSTTAVPQIEFLLNMLRIRQLLTSLQAIRNDGYTELATQIFLDHEHVASTASILIQLDSLVTHAAYHDNDTDNDPDAAATTQQPHETVSQGGAIEAVTTTVTTQNESTANNVDYDNNITANVKRKCDTDDDESTLTADSDFFSTTKRVKRESLQEDHDDDNKKYSHQTVASVTTNP